MGGICNWTQGMIDLLLPQAQASGITATISVNPISVFVGETVNVVIRFTKGTYSWVQNLFFKPTKPGVITINVGNGVNKTVVANDTPKIGKIHPEHDDKIILYADKYSIPRGILKAIIHKETQDVRNSFDPRTSRYEPKRDYQDFQVANPPAGRGMNNTPFSYYVLAGKNAQGTTLSNGLRVSSLPRDYRTTLNSVGNGGWQLRGIVTTDRPPLDGVLTVAELYANDFDLNQGAHSQGWPALSASYTGNFSPQFLISSSYGLGHTMYAEATEAKDPQGNLIMKNSNSPHDIVDDVGLGVELAAGILKGKFRGLISNDNCSGWSDALLRYNGKSDYVTGVNSVCAIYNGNYK